ncbi:MAG: tRNA preQ1(34) S-adenosylmethionine ribosyltransferase-isomerase QueA [Myxococcota bacterium]|nr:tRNA preQ1(34) S-adenosylmethionine ribosyltransferase-isomerase QueA [Myxococcota bacterium]
MNNTRESAIPLEWFDYELPSDLIAQAPLANRDGSRLLVANRDDSSGIVGAHFSDLSEFLKPGDLLVRNESRVLPARVFGETLHGGKIELVFVKPVDAALLEAMVWQAIGRPGKSLRPGRIIKVGRYELEVRAKEGRTITVASSIPLITVMQEVGRRPLPPYIIRHDEANDALDRERYQPVFAKELGSVAAPTASLHFTNSLIEEIKQKGVRFSPVILHVGLGTFLPVPKELDKDIRGHSMHSEYYEVPQATIKAIEETKREGGRIIGVGTTAVRAIESWQSSGEAEGESRLFIYPGYRFQSVDGMITNFHLPRSTLLMLVSAFMGRQRIQELYQRAILEKYRFFSYGDAMLLL